MYCTNFQPCIKICTKYADGMATLISEDSLKLIRIIPDGPKIPLNVVALFSDEKFNELMQRRE